MASQSTTTHYRACNLCEAICGIQITVEDGAVVSIRGDKKDPFSRGHICPKAVALQDIHNDPDRLRQPMRRSRGGEWERVSWDAAFDETAERLRKVRSTHGRDAVAVYLGNPAVHNLGTMLFGPALYRTLRTKNQYSASSVDQLPHHFAASLMFGHQLMIPVPDIDRTQFMLILGANPAVSNGSIMTAPGMRRRLKELRERGGRLIVIDPRRTETAELADRHLFIRPGTDAMLLAALLHVLFEEGLDDPDRLADFTDSIDTLRDLVSDFPPNAVAPATGVPADEIVRLARDFAAAPSAVCYGRLGVSTQEFGGLCQWLVNALNIVTGNLDRPGGAMFTTPAVDLLTRTGRGAIGRWRSRVRGLQSFGSELPVPTLAEEILTDGPERVRGLLTVAGNPVLSTPNGVQLDEALAGLDFMVSIDFYVNETTRHAHLILPPTGPLEHDHYDLAFHVLAVRNTARYSPPLFEPAADTRHDWQILDELQRRLDRRPWSQRARQRLTSRFGPRRLLDLGLRTGPHGSGLNPFGGGLRLAKLERSPHGVDLGPLQRRLPRRLFTPDKRIEAAPEVLSADLSRLAQRLEQIHTSPGDDDTLLLIGRRHLRSNNSWMHNYARLMGGRARCTLLVNPQDADLLNLADGDEAVVQSRVGRVVVPVEISDEVMPGVVSLPHGWGHHREGVRLATAQQHPGASINDLTDDGAVDELVGTAVLSGVPVTVAPTNSTGDKSLDSE
jgi:anaerobic selenocysteine-containing dehydrogenase